jgi:hypothetical protein
MLEWLVTRFSLLPRRLTTPIAPARTRICQRLRTLVTSQPKTDLTEHFRALCARSTTHIAQATRTRHTVRSKTRSPTHTYAPGFARSGNRGSVVMVVPGRCRRCTAALRDRPPDFPPALVLDVGAACCHDRFPAFRRRSVAALRPSPCACDRRFVRRARYKLRLGLGRLLLAMVVC